MYDFTGIGNACLDLVASVDESVLDKFSLQKSRQFVIDEDTKETLIKQLPSIAYNIGGAASNVCHVMTALGCKTAFMGRLANDNAGQIILETMEKIGIDYPMGAITDTDLETAQIFCLTTPDAERTFGSYYGISAEISFDDMDMPTINDSKIVYLDGYSLYSPHAYDAFDKILNSIDKDKTISVFHPGDVSVALNFPEHTQNLIDRCDVVIFNANEARACFPNTSLEDITKHLKDKNKTGAITLGSDGAYVFKDGELMKVDTPQNAANPIDTCGAGDHFSGGFLYGLINGFDLKNAGILGCRCGADAIKRYGARPVGSLKHYLEGL